MDPALRTRIRGIIADVELLLKANASAFWRNDVPVVPGASYKLEFDVKAAEGAGAAGFRVAAEGKTIASQYFHRKDDGWAKYCISFKIPDETKNISLYFVVCEGLPEKTVYLDNVLMERLRQ